MDLVTDMDKAKLYFEGHVTIEPVFDERRELAASIALKHKFKLADLLMKKREEDTEERSAKDTIMTGHGTSLLNMKFRTIRLVQELQRNNFKVWRYKIEDTILDSRHDDELHLLG